MPTVAADHVASLAALMVEKRKDRKKKTPFADRQARPLTYWLMGLKQSTGISGDFVSKTIKYDADLTLSTWSGDTTLPDPESIHNHITIDFEYSNFFMAYKLVHDEYRKFGYTILPNGTSQSVRGRVRHMSDTEYETLKKKLDEDLESKDDSWERKLDLALHLQGTTSDDLPGLNALMPIANTGLFGGHERARNPMLQHHVFAGEVTEALSGTKRIQGAGTTGASGTLKRRLEDILRYLGSFAAGSGMKSGRWVIFAGTGAINKLKDEYERIGITWNRNAGGGGKVDLTLMDNDLEIGGNPIIWDPTLDLMDSVATSEQGVGISGGTVSLTGGGGSGANAVVVVNASGVITDVIVTNSGSGFTSAPTVGVSNLGGGSGATFQAYVYSDSSGAGLVTVDAADKRIGKLAYVEVTGGGSGYTAGTPVSFTNRFYLLYEPAWEMLHQDGMDRHMSIPADQPRKRSTEVQCDATYFLTQCLPVVNGIVEAR